eukprot:SAG11_NODE_4233_length_1997_cov_1.303477_3_plen_144_part_00
MKHAVVVDHHIPARAVEDQRLLVELALVLDLRVRGVRRDRIRVVKATVQPAVAARVYCEPAAVLMDVVNVADATQVARQPIDVVAKLEPADLIGVTASHLALALALDHRNGCVEPAADPTVLVQSGTHGVGGGARVRKESGMP